MSADVPFSGFTHYCPNGKGEEQYAHDITDSMGVDSITDRFLYCRRCGQTVPVREAIELTDRATRAAA